MIKIYANIPGIGRKQIDLEPKPEVTPAEASEDWFDFTGKVGGLRIKLSDGSFIIFRNDVYKNTVWEIVEE